MWYVNALRIGDVDVHDHALGANTISITISTTVSFLYYEDGMSPLNSFLVRVVGDTSKTPSSRCVKEHMDRNSVSLIKF